MNNELTKPTERSREASLEDECEEVFALGGNSGNSNSESNGRSGQVQNHGLVRSEGGSIGVPQAGFPKSASRPGDLHFDYELQAQTIAALQARIHQMNAEMNNTREPTLNRFVHDSSGIAMSRQGQRASSQNPGYADQVTNINDLNSVAFQAPRTTLSPLNCSPNVATISRASRRTLPLRQWIKGALDSSANKEGRIPGAPSTAYIEAALKIALSLAEQINLVEKGESESTSEALDSLPVRPGGDWANYVNIKLKANDENIGEGKQKEGEWPNQHLPFATGPLNGNAAVSTGSEDRKSSGFPRTREEEDEWLSQPLPFAASATSGTEAVGVADEDGQDMNDQLENFLRSFGMSDSGDTRAAPQIYESSAQKVPGALGAKSDFDPLKSEVPNYLNIESAEIYKPEKAQSICFSTNVTTSQKRLQRIFSFGLLCYEMFSGGRTPPPELLTLALSDGAFLSLPTLSIIDKCGNDEEIRRKSHRTSSLSDGGAGLHQSSFNLLKDMGLPSPLCHLITNALQCVHGDLSKDEGYTKMVDVAFDLKLMIEKPDKFLRDLDVTLSLTGLQLNESTFREEEFESIQTCYRHRVSGSHDCDLIVICGDSGTGKSFLARRVGRYVASQGGLFLSAKYDQMQQANPFSALAFAFDHYCDILIEDGARGANWVNDVLSRLHALGRDNIYHLAKVIPKLGHIFTRAFNLDTLRMPATFLDDSCVDALQRLKFLLCKFVDLISSYSQVSVTLFLDDLQWGDEASISVLNQLLMMMKDHKKFFFIGSFRGERRHDHRFWKMVESAEEFGIRSKTIKLTCMDKCTVTRMISETLCLPPRLVRSLAEIIYSKTKGNALFFAQLMLSLNRDGLLTLSLSDQRWVFDELQIQSRQLPDNVALKFINDINKLSPEVQSALHTLAMFGASAKIEYLKTLESSMSVSIIDPLKVASAEGLVFSMKSSFHFCHDRIQQACYNAVDQRIRPAKHLIFGRCLIKPSLESMNNDMLFTAVNQINFGGPTAVYDNGELALMAKYNLVAGRKAVEMSDFSVAHQFFSNGIAFLPPNHWACQYSLSLELYEAASKSALATGNISSLQVLSSEMAKHARCFADRLNIEFIVVSAMFHTSKVPEALGKSCEILLQLGEGVPSSPSREALVEQIQQTQSMIRGISEDQLLNYRLMTDNTKLVAMRFLAKIEIIALIVDPMLHPFITLKMVQLTVTYGLSPFSPIGLAYFGSLLGKLGNVQVGNQFALLSRSLVEKLNAKECSGEVMGVSCDLRCFVEPLQSANELRKQAEFTAMSAGDVPMAVMNRLQYCLVSFWAGNKLLVMIETVSKACQFMKEQGTSLLFLLTLRRTILTLAGSQTEELGVQGNKNPLYVMFLCFHNMYLTYMLKSGSELKKYTETFLALEKGTWFLFAGYIPQAFFVSLSSYRIYRDTCDPTWLERARKRKEDIKLWAEQGSSHNFQQKLLLLEAEDNYCSGCFDTAREAYQHAIVSARSHKFINDEALACELAAKFFLETNALVDSLEHFRLAIEKYTTWGALAKTKMISTFTKEKFTIHSGDSPSLPGSEKQNGDFDYIIGPRKRRI